MKTLPKIIITAIICLVIGFFLGMEYKAYQVRSAFNEAFNGRETTNIVNEELIEEIIVEKKIGDEIELATLKFKINSFKETNILSAKYSQPTVAKTGAKFVVVDLDITNITKEPYTYYERDGFVLGDTLERIFQPYNSIGKIDNYMSGRALAPSITENGKMVFELPQDATKYEIAIGKAGTNEVFVIMLN